MYVAIHQKAHFFQSFVRIVPICYNPHIEEWMVLLQHAGQRCSPKEATTTTTTYQFVSLETKMNCFMTFEEMVKDLVGHRSGCVLGGSESTIKATFLKSNMTYIESGTMYVFGIVIGSSSAHHGTGPQDTRLTCGRN